MKIHQGDVLLEQVAELPADAVEIGKEIIQWGEATGHAHRIKNSRVFSAGGQRYAALDRPEPMTHDDHPETKKIPCAVFKIRVQEEYFPEGKRQVRD